MKLLKKAGSLFISMAIILSTVIVAFGIPAQAQTNYISNNDFEAGETGYLNAGDESLNITVYDNTDTTRPGYGEVAFNGKAAYIEGNGGGVAYAKNNHLQYKIENLPAGQYSVKMDVLLNHLNTSAWATLAFGVTNAFDAANGRAYSKNIISDSATVTENETPVTIATGSLYHRVPGNSLAVGWHDLDVSMSFTITETTTVYFFVFCDGDPAKSVMNATAYVDNIFMSEEEREPEEPKGIVNGDFSDGLNGYEISDNKSHDEAISVIDEVCYIPLLTSTVAADKPYNRWINQKVTLKNGTYIFSYDLDITYTSASAWAFAHAVRNAENMDADIIRPHSGSEYKGITVGAPTVETLDYVLNTADEADAAPLNSFALSNSSKYYNYSGTAGRQVGKVSFEVTVDNPISETTSLYFSMGCYANVCFAYIDNISITEKQDEPEEYAGLINGDFEEGKKGYMYADDASSKIEIYDNNDTDRPGYGVVALDGKAAYVLGGGDSAPTDERKNYPLQYMIDNLPAGEYTIHMNVLLNMIDTSAWAPLAFGITDGLNAKGYAYGVRLINSTGQSSNVQFTNYSVNVTENGADVIANPSHLYHRIAGAALSEGWHDLDVSISFKTTEKKTLFFFLHCSGDGTDEGAKATAYIDNVTFAPGHVLGDWLTDETNHWKVCSGCGEIIDKAAHIESDWIIDLEATTTAAGHQHKECTVCGKVLEEEDVPKLIAHTPGDINGDFEVNNKDLTRLFQYLSEWDVVVDEAALDVNGDGDVNNKDLTRLFQYLSEWDVEIF